MTRETPKDWVWAYHATHQDVLPDIAREGLKPHHHANITENIPVIFVEPTIEGVMPYYYPEDGAILRFKTPGFGFSEDTWEDVLFAGSSRKGVNVPDAPFVGAPGEDGVIPPERIQILVGKKFRWLVP